MGTELFKHWRKIMHDSFVELTDIHTGIPFLWNEVSIRKILADNLNAGSKRVYLIHSMTCHEINGYKIDVNEEAKKLGMIMNNKTEQKPHPHAALIMQYARDAQKTDKPWLWWKIRSGLDKKFEQYGMILFCADKEYKRIPQWEIDGLKIGDLVTIDDSSLPCEIISLKKGNGYEHYYVQTNINSNGCGLFSNSRVKKYEPKTININGFEVPEPVQCVED